MFIIIVDNFNVIFIFNCNGDFNFFMLILSMIVIMMILLFKILIILV